MMGTIIHLRIRRTPRMRVNARIDMYIRLIHRVVQRGYSHELVRYGGWLNCCRRYVDGRFGYLRVDAVILPLVLAWHIGRRSARCYMPCNIKPRSKRKMIALKLRSPYISPHNGRPSEFTYGAGTSSYTRSHFVISHGSTSRQCTADSDRNTNVQRVVSNGERCTCIKHIRGTERSTRRELCIRSAYGCVAT